MYHTLALASRRCMIALVSENSSRAVESAGRSGETEEYPRARRCGDVPLLRALSRRRLPHKLLKPVLDNDEPVRDIRIELANHQEPSVVDTDRVLCGVLVRLVRGRGEKSGASRYRERRPRPEGRCHHISGSVTIEQLVPLVRPLRLGSPSR